jgi:hypothetical protein
VVVPQRYDPTRWEFRFGGFAHGVGSIERETWDINAEIVVGSFFGRAALGVWSPLIPRLHAGVNLNVSGRHRTCVIMRGPGDCVEASFRGATSVGYVGLLWTLPVTDHFFVEAFLDGAAHDGSATGSPRQVALGCEAQFHLGGSAGYRFSPQWSVMLTFDHLSNGNAIGLSTCGRNQGLNNVGARIGFAF